jgi:hypothetical protein
MKNKAWQKIFIIGFSGLIATSFLTGCGGSAGSASSSNSEKANAEASPTPTTPPVSDAEFKAALAKMKVIKDDVKGLKWYEDKTSYNYYWHNEFYVYTSDGPSPTLFLNIRYFGEDWLFIDSYFFNVDGETFTFTPDPGQIQTDNDSNVTEWYNEAATPDNIELIQKIMNSKKTVMRLEGSKYYKDVIITDAQKAAIKNVLTVYQGLGGKL